VAHRRTETVTRISGLLLIGFAGLLAAGFAALATRREAKRPTARSRRKSRSDGRRRGRGKRAEATPGVLSDNHIRAYRSGECRYHW